LEQNETLGIETYNTWEKSEQDGIQFENFFLRSITVNGRSLVDHYDHNYGLHSPKPLQEIACPPAFGL
jgi:hypothetical protein